MSFNSRFVVRHSFMLCSLLLGLTTLSSGCGSSQQSEIPSPTQRTGIVSMAPHLTETIFALGLGNRLTAVGSFDDYPPEIEKLPRVGGYMDPDLEKISMLAPELIILPGRHEKVTSYARLYEIPVLNIHMDSLETILEGIRTLGDALSCEEAAESLITEMENDMAALAAQVAEYPRRKTLIITARQPGSLNTLYTTGGTSFVSEIAALAGAENIHEEVSQAYFTASKETVVMRAPEVILEFRAGEELSDSDIERLKSDWEQMPTLPAVREGRIYIITESHALRPGPRIVDIARIIAEKIHPDIGEQQ